MATSIQALYDDLKARKEAHEAATQDLQAEADALRDQIAPLEGRRRDLQAKLRAAREASGYDTVIRELAKLQRVIEDQSGKGPTRVTLKAEGSETASTPGTI
jgi:predicted  nucleic acid-binding Zn-ribbon protein